jgi:hypothetical protein
MTVNTVDEYWSWTPPGGSAISLQQPWLGVATIGGSRLGVPTLRGQDYEVPFRSGMVWRPKFPGPRTVTLVMWTAGIDQATGVPADDQRLAWNDNWNAIRRAFWNRGVLGSLRGTLTRQWLLTQGGVPVMVSADALAEVAGSMEPAMTGRTRADFSVDLLLADPYFYGPVRTQTVARNNTTLVTSRGDGVVGEGTGGSFTATFTGPLTSPVLTSDAGLSVSLDLFLPAAYTVTLDLLNFTATDSLGANQVAAVSHSGSRMWMALPSGDSTLMLTSGSGTDSGSVLLSWQDPYL